MNGAVGAALKKIAVMIVSDRDNLKAVGVIVLTLLVALVMPITSVMGILSGTIELDEDALRRQIVENLSAENFAMLSGIEDTMTYLGNAMTEAGFSSRATEAQVLYVLALFEYSSQSDFVVRLVSCFQEGESDTQLIAAVNAAFGTDIDAGEFSDTMRSIRATAINVSGFTDPASKNNLDLVEWAKAAQEAGWGYVWGTYGRVLTRDLLEAKLEQYPDGVGAHKDFIRANWLGGRTADCIGLIKGYSWYNSETGEISYGTNGMPDIGANQMYAYAIEKGTVDTIPEVPGILVWHEGHIGIYIGNGEVIEARGTRYGVVKTELENRSWTHWCKNPYIRYEEECETTEPTTETEETT